MIAAMPSAATIEPTIAVPSPFHPDLDVNSPRELNAKPIAATIGMREGSCPGTAM